MQKDFKTIDELIALLESRGVETDMQTRIQIMRESYYAIVNGYKDPFLDRMRMQDSASDVYKEGTRFSWLYELFMFDRDLRNITFKYITRAEAVMKNAVVYAFCRAHQNPEDYLSPSSYVSARNMLFPKSFRGKREIEYQRRLSHLLGVLGTRARAKNKAFTKHYVNKYGFVPLWVLENSLTFGNIAHFYQLQERRIQNAACKIVLEATGKDDMDAGFLTPQKLLHAFAVLVDFRNICAHDERLYCTRTGRSRDISYARMFSILEIILPDSGMENMEEELLGILGTHASKLHSISPERLLQDMGFCSRCLEWGLLLRQRPERLQDSVQP